MSNTCKSCGMPTWNDFQMCDACSEVVEQEQDNIDKFNRKEKNYQPIRWTNVALFWIFYFLEVAFAASQNGSTPNIFGVFLTFFIARYFARKWYSKGENKFKSSFTKIAVTIGIYFSTLIIKQLVLLTLLNILL